MKSKKAFFDGTVFKKTVARFWPLWASYFAIWLVILPLSGLMSLQEKQTYYLHNPGSSYNPVEHFALQVVPNSQQILILSILFGALVAMAVFSHLYNARSANLFGSLPVRREGLFLTHYLAGLAFLLVPNAVIFLLTLLVEMAGGYVAMNALLFWLMVSCGTCFLFYSMAVFCAMFTGHILAMPVFYGVLNVLALGIESLVRLVLDSFFYGYDGNGGLSAVTTWLTPAYNLSRQLVPFGYRFGNAANAADGETVTGVYSVLGNMTPTGRGSLLPLGIYVLVALVLTVAALLLYRARRLESAGDVVSVKVMRPVFKYGVAFCVGALLGLLTTMFTNGSTVVLMVATVVWGVVGYFAAQMLLDKSFRVFRQWKGAVAVAAVFAAIYLVVGLDLTGFETRIPDSTDVESVEILGLRMENSHQWDSGSEMNITSADPEMLQLANLLHREAVAQRELYEGNGVRVYTEDTPPSIGFSLRYHLKGGGTLSRQYWDVELDPAEVEQEDTAAWAVQKLYDDRALCWEQYGFANLERCLENGGVFDQVTQEHYSDMYGMEEDAYYYGEDARALLAAVKEDFFAGRVGVRRVDGKGSTRWYDELRFGAITKGNPGEPESIDVTIVLRDTASSTWAALEEMADRADYRGDKVVDTVYYD